MYIPKHYEKQNLAEVRAFLKANSFGILLTTAENKIWGTHIPLELEPDLDNGQEVFYGHVAKGNRQWQQFEQKNNDVLLIFNGPQAYVSSSWYGYEEVPTWNYIAVHVYGKIQIIDEEELLYALTRLVDKHEQHSAKPIRVQNLSSKTMRQIRGIVGFKVSISEIQAAYKLSQKHNEADYNNIVHHLKRSPKPSDQAVGKAMLKERDVE